MIKGDKMSTFYGLIDKTELEKVCLKAGFNIEQSYIKGESAYVLANKDFSVK